MNSVQEIKSRLLASMYQQLGWSITHDVRKVYLGLSPAQHANLAQYASQLKAYMEEQGDSLADAVLLQLACLVPAALRGKPSFLVEQSPIMRPLYQSELVEGRKWILVAMSLAQSFRDLTPEQMHNLLAPIVSDPTQLYTSDTPSDIFLSFVDNLKPQEDAFEATRFDISLCKHWQDLSAAEARDLASMTIDMMQIASPDANDAAEEMLLYIACLVPEALKGGQYDLASNRIFTYPGVLYYGADPATSEHLISQLDNSGIPDYDLNIALVSLAWIGDANVRSAFQRWEEQPPPWRDEIYIQPSEYAKEAGWQLTSPGERHDLTFDGCFRLLPSDEPGGPVSILIPGTSICGNCNRNMITLLDLDLTSLRLTFLGIKGARLRISTCDWCGIYSDAYFTEIDLEGKSEWSNVNIARSVGQDDEPYYSQSEGTMVLASEPYNPLAAFVCDSSQLGGFPAWVQGVAYPVCPLCSQTMLFLGQLATQDFQGEFSEGTTYCLVCPQYHMAATVYQQT